MVQIRSTERREGMAGEISAPVVATMDGSGWSSPELTE
jgi:hypothetical protein